MKEKELDILWCSHVDDIFLLLFLLNLVLYALFILGYII